MRLGKLTRIAAAAMACSALLVASSAGQSGAPEPNVATPTVFTGAPPLPPEAERMRLRDGLAAAASGDWIGLANLRDGASDPLVRRMLQWRYATANDAPLSFYEISQALDELQGWPGRATMRNRAERAILDSTLSARERIDFLRRDNGPTTGDGRIALAIALKQTGERSEAHMLARNAWREDELSANAENQALQEFDFDSDDYRARVDALLWRNRRGEAQRWLGRLSAGDRAVANARIALQARQRRGLQALVDAVPGSHADDVGFVFDRGQYRRRMGAPEEALPLMAELDARNAPMAARAEIFTERRLYVSRALRNGNYRQAYALVSNHGLTSGEAFADAEWLAGWVSLRFMNDPTRAAEHFAHLSQNVSSPVSLSRALYWRAQAERARGNTAEANDLLAQASRFNFTFYGQLSASQSDRNDVIAFSDTARVSDEARTRFHNRELVRALRLMAEVGAQRDFESIAYYLDDTLDDPMELELLSTMARDQGYNRTALRSAKAGLFRGVIAANAAYPTMTLPDVVRSSGRPEAALVHAIIRQESEFDPSAISSANARGLMQLIPSTAQATARKEGLPYRRDGLLGDPAYNMTLGAAHLSHLVDRYAGSWSMTFAAYNAGPHRVTRWLEEYGDPRSAGVDPLDWIELVPFEETRNYIQRVLENAQIYRARASNAPIAGQLALDIGRGGSTGRIGLSTVPVVNGVIPDVQSRIIALADPVLSPPPPAPPQTAPAPSVKPAAPTGAAAAPRARRKEPSRRRSDAAPQALPATAGALPEPAGAAVIIGAPATAPDAAVPAEPVKPLSMQPIGSVDSPGDAAAEPLPPSAETGAPDGDDCITYSDFIAQTAREDASASDLNAGALAELQGGGGACEARDN
jgi:soluble lytic murein transglycosylase